MGSYLVRRGLRTAIVLVVASIAVATSRNSFRSVLIVSMSALWTPSSRTGLPSREIFASSATLKVFCDLPSCQDLRC